jgi:hypothetical protein
MDEPTLGVPVSAYPRAYGNAGSQEALRTKMVYRRKFLNRKRRGWGLVCVAVILNQPK